MGYNPAFCSFPIPTCYQWFCLVTNDSGPLIGGFSPFSSIYRKPPCFVYRKWRAELTQAFKVFYYRFIISLFCSVSVTLLTESRNSRAEESSQGNGLLSKSSFAWFIVFSWSFSRGATWRTPCSYLLVYFTLSLQVSRLSVCLFISVINQRILHIL